VAKCLGLFRLKGGAEYVEACCDCIAYVNLYEKKAYYVVRVAPLAIFIITTKLYKIITKHL